MGRVLRRVVGVVGGVVFGAGVLTGCVGSGGDSVTVTYEAPDGTQSVTFTPRDITCDDRSASGLSFPEVPLNYLSLGRDDLDYVSAWVNTDELVYFDGEDATIVERVLDDGRIEFRAEGQPGRVAVTVVDVDASVNDRDLADAEWFEGTIDLVATCTPEEGST